MKILLTIDPENYVIKNGVQDCNTCPLRNVENCQSIFKRMFWEDCYKKRVSRINYDKYEEIP